MAEKALSNPTYGELIDLLKDADCYCSEETTCSASQVLHTKFNEAYPHISVGRPQRLYDTAKRIAAPTLPSLRGESKLFGLALEEYRSKEWVPRTRNAGPMADFITFPNDLRAYGLDERLLAEVFTQVQAQQEPSWYVRGIPDYGFYQDLHNFLTRWPLTSKSTKVLLGKFYIAIDKNLQARGFRPDNAYRFIEKIAMLSKCCRNSIVNYGSEKIQVSTLVKECTEQVHMLMSNLSFVKTEYAEMKKQLQCIQYALEDVTSEMKAMKKQEAIYLQRLCESAGYSDHA